MDNKENDGFLDSPEIVNNEETTEQTIDLNETDEVVAQPEVESVSEIEEGTEEPKVDAIVPPVVVEEPEIVGETKETQAVEEVITPETKPKKGKKYLSLGVIGGITLILMLLVVSIGAMASRSPLEKLAMNSMIGDKVTATTTISLDNGVTEDVLDELGMDDGYLQQLIDYYDEFDQVFVTAYNGSEEAYFAYEEHYEDETVYAQLLWTDYELLLLQYPGLIETSFSADIEDQMEFVRGYQDYIKYIDYKAMRKTDTYKVFKKEFEKLTKEKSSKIIFECDEEELVDLLDEVFDEMEDDELLMEILRDSFIEMFEAMIEDDFEIEIDDEDLDEDDWEDAIDYLEDDFEDEWEDGIDQMADDFLGDAYGNDFSDMVSMDIEVVYHLNFIGKVKRMEMEVSFDVMDTDIGFEVITDYDYKYKSPKETYEVVEFDDVMKDETLEDYLDELKETYVDHEMVDELLEDYTFDRDADGSHVDFTSLAGFILLDGVDGDVDDIDLDDLLEGLFSAGFY